MITTCELRTFEVASAELLRCHFLGIGEIHKMSHNVVSNQEDFTAPIALLKINRCCRSNLIIPRDFPPQPRSQGFPLKGGRGGKKVLASAGQVFILNIHENTNVRIPAVNSVF